MTREIDSPSESAIIDAEMTDGVDRDALLGWLTTATPQLVPAGTRMSIRQFPSGFSNLTYRVSILADDVERLYVLRRPPRGSVEGNAHNMGREHDLLALLHPLGVPVPRPIVRCDDAGIIGAPFYLMEHVDGVILRGAVPEELPTEPNAALATMRALSHTFVSVLAQLHAVEIVGGPLGAWGRPEGYLQRQIDGWTRRWYASRIVPVLAMDEVARWLATHCPHTQGSALIHNDFKFDNLVLDRASTSRVVAILDWEMATIGDPLMDLGTALAYWVEAGDAPIFSSLGLGVTAQAGSATRAELVRAYGAATGRDVSDAAYYYAFGLFKVSVIAQQIHRRYTERLTRDSRFGALDKVVVALGDAAARVTATGQL